ncbi:MAG TPA: type II and III secretion system protein family protein [Verrucomicrobiae bacterium]|nr:type II and III secretion system protein family protein [Verrucomicrobiae bacterium]
MNNAAKAVLAVVLGSWAIAAGAQQKSAAPVTVGKRATVNAVYEVPLYKSAVVPMDRPAVRVSVGNPGVADILVIRSRELYVVGKALGSTNVVVWDDSGRAAENFDIEVTHDLATLKAKLFDLLPGEGIVVSSAQEELVLTGQVSSASRMGAALELARGFLPDCIVAASDAPGSSGKSARADSSCKKGGVVNLMQIGGAQQVMLKVTVAELAHSVVKRLESSLNLLKFGADGGRFSGGAVSGGATFPDAVNLGGNVYNQDLNPVTPIFGAPAGGLGPIGPAQDLFAPDTPSIEDTGLVLGYLRGSTFVQAVLDISKRNGTAKILSEPTLTTLTGQEATFLSGGEFPIPVPQGGLTGGVTVTFKEFGVGLKFTPVVLDSGRINLALNVTVSEISGDNAVAIGSGASSSTFAIPSLTKRNAASTVELGDGQTIGIAGLINDSMREFVQKFPLLGDLPIIGALFRSQEFRSGQSELVILVTPYLAKPMSVTPPKLPTDVFLPPGDLDFYLLGNTGWTKDRPAQKRSSWATPATTPVPTRAPASTAPMGAYGHDLGKPAASDTEKKQ